MTTERRETEIIDALTTLRATTQVPPANPESERALLAAFDARWARPRRAFQRSIWVGTAAAASMAIALAFGRLGVGDVPSSKSDTTPDATLQLAGFVPWPGAQALPPLESGALQRIDLPVAALPALGLSVPASAASVVPADVIIGQDGMARAIRLAHQQ